MSGDRTATVLLGHDGCPDVQQARYAITDALSPYSTILSTFLDGVGVWTNPDNGVEVPETCDAWVIVYHDDFHDEIRTRLAALAEAHNQESLGFICTEAGTDAWVEAAR